MMATIFSQGRFNMRKVLLATTALVALNVSAASADISISGNMEFEYLSTSTTDTMKTDGNVTIVASKTTDSGLTFSVTQNNTLMAAGVEDAFMTISSAEMGTLQLGQGDDIFDRMDGALGENNDIESDQLPAGASTDMAGSAMAINYMSPSIGGLKVGVYADSDNDETGFAFNYSMAGVNLYYGTKEDQSNLGASASFAGFKINVGSRKVDNTTEKAADVGVSYVLGNGIKVAALSSRGTTSTGTKVKYSNIGAQYTIADGITAQIEQADNDGENSTWLGLTVNF
jgi:hypothetical protein